MLMLIWIHQINYDEVFSVLFLETYLLCAQIEADKFGISVDVFSVLQ